MREMANGQFVCHHVSPGILSFAAFRPLYSVYGLSLSWHINQRFKICRAFYRFGLYVSIRVRGENSHAARSTRSCVRATSSYHRGSAMQGVFSSTCRRSGHVVSISLSPRAAEARDAGPCEHVWSLVSMLTRPTTIWLLVAFSPLSLSRAFKEIDTHVRSP